MMQLQKLPQLLMFLAILALFGVFFFPLWKITLKAAQFPEGLELNIWINKFSGQDGNQYIIQNINILNHYIGMKKIEPDSIPELKYFPLIIYALGALGIISLFINKKWGYGIWTGALGILSLLGVYDFYLWMYDYGHNLDPNAPIKLAGVDYMPPVFGEKDLLNFYVTSYPKMGTYFLGISFITAGIAFYLSNKQQII